MRKFFHVVFALFLILLTVLCSNNPLDSQAGSGTKTGNVKGTLAKADGTPAANQKVYFYPVGSLPGGAPYDTTGGSPKMLLSQLDSTFTDDKGYFCDSLKEGLYNVTEISESY